MWECGAPPIRSLYGRWNVSLPVRLCTGGWILVIIGCVAGDEGKAVLLCTLSTVTREYLVGRQVQVEVRVVLYFLDE